MRSARHSTYILPTKLLGITKLASHIYRMTTLAYILKTFPNPKKKNSSFWQLFSCEYEYLNHFFPARSDLSKFHVFGLKITQGLLYKRTDFVPKEVAIRRLKVDKKMLHYHSNSSIDFSQI